MRWWIMKLPPLFSYHLDSLITPHVIHFRIYFISMLLTAIHTPTQSSIYFTNAYHGTFEQYTLEHGSKENSLGTSSARHLCQFRCDIKNNSCHILSTTQTCHFLYDSKNNSCHILQHRFMLMAMDQASYLQASYLQKRHNRRRGNNIAFFRIIWKPSLMTVARQQQQSGTGGLVINNVLPMLY